jgi:phosphoribosylanthranilate isomerase
MSNKVKICGITNPEDALVAVDAGADALGFVFYEKSPRHVTVKAVAEIIRRLPPFVAKVGVFVDATADTVRMAVAECGLDTLQFHGDEAPEFCGGFAPLKVYKAFRVQNLESLAGLSGYRTDAWLLDGFAPDSPGGTGATFDWGLAREAGTLGRPIILAGGLTPDNVAEAVCRAQPYGVDVSSGVESAPGRKDRRKILRFIAAAKAAGRRETGDG